MGGSSTEMPFTPALVVILDVEIVFAAYAFDVAEFRPLLLLWFQVAGGSTFVGGDWLGWDE